MKKHKKEIVKLVTVEFLSRFFDVLTPFFEASTIYRKSTKQYLHEREIDRNKFWQKIAYLKKKGFIEEFVEEKEKYYKLSEKGKKAIVAGSFRNIKIKVPEKWDGLWRVIVFDVPEKFRHSRDILRRKLFELNFYQIQKSVYVFPHECSKEITCLSDGLWISKNVIIMISKIIQGEEDIIEFFVDRKIIKKEDLITLKNQKSDSV